MSPRTARLFLTITLCCFLWQTSRSVSVKPGRNVTLTCPLKSSLSIGIVTWYKQNAGEGPSMLLSYSVTMPWTVRYAEGLISHRYVVLARGATRKHHRLRILTTQEKDTAVYYCSFSKELNNEKKMPLL